MQTVSGPYIQAAFFCEQVHEDGSGMKSFIHIVDTVTHVETAPSAPTQMPAFQFNSNLVITLKSGNARGNHRLEVLHKLPNNQIAETIVGVFNLEGLEHGVEVTIQYSHPITIEGIHWYEVYVNHQLLTAIPLRVKYKRLGVN